jgi:hypothetical protein
MTLIMSKAADIAHDLDLSWTPNKGWFTRFCNRYNFTRIGLHGEGGDVDLAKHRDAIEKIRKKLEPYSADQIFNMDETGLFYRSKPRFLYVDRSVAGVELRGCKDMGAKDRCTLVVAVNASG